MSWDRASPRHSEALLDRGDIGAFAGFQVVSGHYPHGLHALCDPHDQYEYLTMLRDPLGRSISAFNYLRRDSTFTGRQRDLRAYLQELSLTVYFERHHPRVPNHLYVDNGQVRYLSGVGERKAFGELTRTDLDQAKRNLASMTFGFTDQFNRSMLLCRQALGLRSIDYIPARIGSAAKPSLSDVERKLLRERNALDLELVEYGLELFRARTAHIEEADLARYARQLDAYRVRQRLVGAPRALLRSCRDWAKALLPGRSGGEAGADEGDSR